jgi:malto-oligosyltrehalose trehalohydrolase
LRRSNNVRPRGVTVFHHKLPFGAEIEDDGVRFRFWAPAAEAVSLILNDRHTVPMRQVKADVYEARVPDAAAGTRYAFQLPKGLRVPDPYARFQPEDVHKASEVIDPKSYTWRHAAWHGRPWTDAVICETHVGCFTEAGTFDAARAKLDHLVETGFTAIELMPLADFEGRFNWGYDGVLPFAPDSSYGRPDTLKRLIDEAHSRGLMVLLDVVYNHFGPTGNYLSHYAPQFFTSRYKTPWGDALNFEDGGAAVRQFFVENALYWLNEYRFDGLRFDAVHAIFDNTQPHILDEIAAAVRARVEPHRHVHLILENDKNEAGFLQRTRSAHYSAQWNDDYHHAAHVLLTGETDTFYADYASAPVVSLAKALAEGFVYQGQASEFRKGAPRGSSTAGLPSLAFVNFLQNHDHIGNRADSCRLAALTSTPALRALTALTILSPSIPLFFMGEEWASRTPFHYFCDYHGELAEAVRRGRAEEFPTGANAGPGVDPTSLDAFTASHLDWAEKDQPDHSEHLVFVRRLFDVRHRLIVPHLSDTIASAATVDLHGKSSFRIVWSLADGATLTVIANVSAHTASGGSWPRQGQYIFATHDVADVLPPWSVQVFLDAPP